MRSLRQYMILARRVQANYRGYSLYNYRNHRLKFPQQATGIPFEI